MSSRSPYSHLLSPGRIGSIALRNRIVLAPMGSFLAGEDGHITERHKRFYEERARGGAGLITTEVVAVDYPRGAAMIHQLGLSDDAFIPGLRDLTDRVHALGAKISVQLQHAGKIATKDLCDGRPLSVPSANTRAMQGVLEDLTPDERNAIVKNYRKVKPGNLFRELDEPEILRLIEAFASAAERAKRAGFDGVEIHAGHGYLINEFLSQHSNQRRDAWGGALENRARFLLEILRATRARVGNDFGVWTRVDAEEVDVEDGITREDAVETARLAEASGADAIHVSRYGGPSGIGFTAMIVHEEGELVPYAAAIKAAVDVPVIAVGRLLPETADRAIAEGATDFVAMGRQLLADPELPNKLATRKREEIRPCIHCYTCVGQIFINEAVKCVVNPACAREDDFPLLPAQEPRKILVVGGGPAGLEAARVAALRGHRVTLCERKECLGGTALYSSLVWEANGQLLRYFERELRRLGVDIQLDREVTPDFALTLGPDAVVVAVGAKRELPEIRGAEGPNVFNTDALGKLLRGGPSGRLGRDIAVVGGDLAGLALAAFLVEGGRNVTVIEESPYLAAEMSIPRRWRTLHRLRERGAELLYPARVEAFTESGVEVVTSEGEMRLVKASQILVVSGAVPNRKLATAVENLGFEVHAIGDGEEIGRLEGAILSGALVGRAL